MAALPNFSCSEGAQCSIRRWGDPATSADYIQALRAVTLESVVYVAASFTQRSVATPTSWAAVLLSARFGRKRLCNKNHNLPLHHFHTGE